VTSVVDVWRAIDPEARLVSQGHEGLGDAVRGVQRTRAAPPHLPPQLDGQLLIADAAHVAGMPLDAFVATLYEAELRPVAVLLAAVPPSAVLDRVGEDVPLLASNRSVAALADAASAYLDDEPEHLTRLGMALRLAAAEAALADPAPSAPAGLVAARIRRGVAVAEGGELLALHPRPAGRALAARFAAAYARLFATPSGRSESVRRMIDGLWMLEHPIRTGASIWLFDDVPFARVDEVAAEALGITLRALLRRPTAPEPPAPSPQPAPVVSSGDEIDATLLAVARANGRVAVAARALGVHRNTVLYRLRRARAERGIDPRRAEDALRLLRTVDDR
jgi:hypothetical protein